MCFFHATRTLVGPDRRRKRRVSAPLFHLYYRLFMDDMLYIGLMSGTSLDGVDAVLAAFSDGPDGLRVQTLGHVHRPFSDALKHDFKSLNWAGDNEIHRAQLAANALVQVYAQAIEQLLQAHGQGGAQRVRAIGAHGQTVRHQPQRWDGTGYTVQLNQPALLAERTGVDVVADFRSRDVAAGGQGAPLVPAFHREIFRRTGENVAILNLGGIANISVLAADGRVWGLDTGPANTLLDSWCHRHTGQPWDDAGQWAASGRVIEGLLQALLQAPYFAQQGAKSTGLDAFNLTWLQPFLAPYADAPACDVQATLVELTATTIAQALQATGLSYQHVGVCGGGVFNTYLMGRIQAALGPAVAVRSTAHWGVDPMQVEALAFAWLARQCLHAAPGNVPQATGAKGPRILGAIYQA